MIGNRPDLIERGTIIQANLPKRGHEQGGERPAVVVSRTAMTAGTTIIVLPCSTTLQENPRPYVVILEPEESGLPYTSAVFIQHIRVLDKEFILDRRRGLVVPAAMVRIDSAMMDVMDLFAA